MSKKKIVAIVMGCLLVAIGVYVLLENVWIIGFEDGYKSGYEIAMKQVESR